MEFLFWSSLLVLKHFHVTCSADLSPASVLILWYMIGSYACYLYGRFYKATVNKPSLEVNITLDFMPPQIAFENPMVTEEVLQSTNSKLITMLLRGPCFHWSSWGSWAACLKSECVEVSKFRPPVVSLCVWTFCCTTCLSFLIFWVSHETLCWEMNMLLSVDAANHWPGNLLKLLEAMEVNT